MELYREPALVQPSFSDLQEQKSTRIIFQPRIIGGVWTIGSGSAQLGADGQGLRFGADTFADAPFSVTPAGVLKAVSGTIGGTTLSETALTGGLIRTAASGKRVEMSSNEVRVYDANGDLTGTFSGTEIGGVASALSVLAGLFQMAFFTDDGLGSGLYALGADVDAGMGSDLGDLLLSTRKAAGGGANIVLMPETDGRVTSHVRHKIVPQDAAPDNPEEGDFYVDSDDAQPYFYDGSAWRRVAVVNGAEADWTPGFTGFSANPTVTAARGARVGKHAIVMYYENAHGTSNATSYTITGLPYTPLKNLQFPIIGATDNGTVVNTGIAMITAGSTTIDVYKDHSGAGWTNSGVKGIRSFCITYEIQ